MPSSQTIQDKNAIATDAVFLIALDIDIPTYPTIRIVNNNEDITWNGNTYQQFPFELDEIRETSSGEIPEFTLNISNVNNVIGTYIRQYDAYVKNNGFEPILVSISVVNSKNLADPTPEIQHNTTLLKPSITRERVSFKLGGVNSYNKNVNSRMFRNSCRWKFKSNRCGYTGIETTCNKTFARCKELSNQLRFGSFPTISNKGVIL